MERLALIAAATALLTGCPERPPGNGLPSCEELACGGDTVCLDGACRPRACLELDCPEGQVCQPGQDGPECRLATEDRDGDGAPAQLDCDDDDPQRFPGAHDGCNGVDNNCNGIPDDEAECRDGLICCGVAGCVDPLTSRRNCGACGRRCDLYQECDQGRCVDAPAPVLEGVSPDPLQTGVRLEVVLTGRHLVGFATVFVESESGQADPFEVVEREDGVYYTDQRVLLDGRLLSSGPATVQVARNDGLTSNVLPVVIQGAARPSVTSFAPDPLVLGVESSVSAVGSGFWGETRLLVARDRAEPTFLDLPVRWVSESWLSTEPVLLDPATNEAGEWIAVARNPDGAESEPYPFLVESAPSPGLSGVSPADGRLGATVTLTVHGHDMFGRPALRLSPEEDPERVVGPLPLALVSPSRLVAEPLVLSADLFSLGRHLLWVENPDGAESNRVPFLVVE